MDSCLLDAKNSPMSSVDMSTEEPSEQMMLDAVKEEAAKLTYEIVNVETNDKEAVVSVKYTYSDSSPVIIELVSKYTEKAMEIYLAGGSDEDIEAALGECFVECKETVERGTGEGVVKFACVLKDNEWLISDTKDEEDADILVNVFTCNLDSALAQ